MNYFFRYLFFIFIIKPVMFFVLGINLRHAERLPQKGPALLVANHNSHLDTLALMSLFPLQQQPSIRPVAAADYFLRSWIMAWFSKNMLGIIPITRSRKNETDNPLQPISEALSRNEIIIFYPEGTRGEPEITAKFKSGIAYLAKDHPTVLIYPLFIYGAGKALPKGSALLVPFAIDIYVGPPLTWSGDKNTFMHTLEQAILALKEEAHPAEWT